MWRLGFVTPSLESYLHFNKRIEQSHRIRQASAVVTIKNDKIGIETFFSILVLRIKVGIQPQLFSLAKDPCIFNFQKRLPILANLGEGLTPNFGQSFGTFVRSEGPRVALFHRAVVCENYSVITVSLVSQSSAINLSVEMRIPNTKSAPGKYHNCSKCASQIPNTKGAPGKYHNCALNIYVVALHLLHILPEQKYRERCDQRSVDTFNKFHRKFNQLC